MPTTLLINLNPLIFRAYDIRGIALTDSQSQQTPDLTPQTARLIGQGTGTYLKRNYQSKNMLVGLDNRLHSPSLQQAFIEGVLSTGIDVTNIGLATSPLLYYAVCRYQMDSGVNITASHNPKEYNGVKIVRTNAHSVCGDELQAILQLIIKNDFDNGKGQHFTKDDIFADYVTDMQSRFKLARPLKIVVDAGNGTAGKFAPQLLRAIGCEVVELYCDLDGNYPNHEANPEEEKNMHDLGALVIKEKADLGIGFDGDGDRVGIVDENGKHYSADWLLILLTRELLAIKPGSQIVFDVKVSKVLIYEIQRLNGIAVMSKTGHSFIESRMHELGAPLGGEISGHMFFGKPHYNYYGFDDAFFAALKIIEILSKSEKSFSRQFDGLTKMQTTPEFKARCPDERKFKIVEELKNYFTDKYDCITIDGVRINFAPDAWGAVRCSNTSPNLTLRFEAATKEKLAEIQNIMVDQLTKYPEVDLSWHEKVAAA